jgi:hypothetical protein
MPEISARSGLLMLIPAALGSFLKAPLESQERWLSQGMSRIVLSGDSAEHLTSILGPYYRAAATHDGH